jgi:hypothetical protein
MEVPIVSTWGVRRKVGNPSISKDAWYLLTKEYEQIIECLGRDVA